MAVFSFFYKQKPSSFSIFVNLSFIFLISCFAFSLYYSQNHDDLVNTQNSLSSTKPTLPSLADEIGCKSLHAHQDKCHYVKSNAGCQFLGYISYLQLFYCSIFAPCIGYILLILWLVLLFYLLGDTAANYFCSSLEGLSSVLRLSPIVAGATLLSLGNGAPDIFSGIVSFVGGEGTEDVGLNSILGGALFVSSVVVGVIGIFVGGTRTISRFSFVRDILFFILSLLCLLVIIILGEISVWGALSFLSLYFVYVAIVFTSQMYSNEKGEGNQIITTPDYLSPAPGLPVTQSFPEDEPEKLATPLLGYAINGEKKGETQILSLSGFSGKILQLLDLPLWLPRRLTIPVIAEESWSKPFAVISVTIAPLTLALIWNAESEKSELLVYAIGGSVGIVLGTIVFFTTERSNPPTECLLIWLGGGFLMSVTWTYILAQELVSLLVSLGLILGISPSILGLTVLAWGNSLGDLAANVTMARNGGSSGAQVAISGCYAGPIFNTLVGLGLSLSFSAWIHYPSNYFIPKDPYVYETLGFLVGGLLWALVILPRREMRLDRFLGGGLLAIYVCFLSIKIARTLGLLQFHDQIKITPLLSNLTSHTSR